MLEGSVTVRGQRNKQLSNYRGWQQYIDVMRRAEKGQRPESEGRALGKGERR